MESHPAPHISITYCTQCQWLLRAGWMAQELLSTFATDLAGVTLVPGTGGIFQVRYDDVLIWDRKTDGGFPDAKILKQRVRDRLDPARDLGHIDRAHTPAGTT
ncbi:SelT/SelW/SelH family protein [Alcaligenaceae bacterium SJ-26]|nr:SelT/SelW/SelH family protein [Alcaligenaceae bacterium SJ-26]